MTKHKRDGDRVDGLLGHKAACIGGRRTTGDISLLCNWRGGTWLHQIQFSRVFMHLSSGNRSVWASGKFPRVGRTLEEATALLIAKVMLPHYIVIS